MNDRYLHEPEDSGPAAADPLLQALERDLGSLRRDAPLPELPLAAPREVAPVHRFRRLLALGAAAAVLVAGLLVVVQELTERQGSVFRLDSTAGLVVSSDMPETDAPLRFGQRLTAAPDATVTVQVGELGRVELRDRGVLTVRAPREEHGDGRYRLELAHGTLEAWIDAPARAFLVETPWFEVWDLGCHYYLEVNEEGSGTLVVLTGAVRFQGERTWRDLVAGERMWIVAGEDAEG
ncbi:MAG: FecR family protein [Planctomycetota bacterium]|jgi:hypothetical protein